MSLRPVTVLVSASGAPGTAALVRALRENGEREVRLVGVDMSERAIGRHLCGIDGIPAHRSLTVAQQDDGAGPIASGLDGSWP